MNHLECLVVKDHELSFPYIYYSYLTDSALSHIACYVVAYSEKYYILIKLHHLLLAEEQNLHVSDILMLGGTNADQMTVETLNTPHPPKLYNFIVYVQSELHFIFGLRISFNIPYYIDAVSGLSPIPSGSLRWSCRWGNKEFSSRNIGSNELDIITPGGTHSGIKSYASSALRAHILEASTAMSEQMSCLKRTDFSIRRHTSK
uniref:Uncharacterized protein n=1 Tax=Megaselia scalaris TaxID=36166 RepID=T1GPD9_MEGSC